MASSELGAWSERLREDNARLLRDQAAQAARIGELQAQHRALVAQLTDERNSAERRSWNEAAKARAAENKLRALLAPLKGDDMTEEQKAAAAAADLAIEDALRALRCHIYAQAQADVSQTEYNGKPEVDRKIVAAVSAVEDFLRVEHRNTNLPEKK